MDHHLEKIMDKKLYLKTSVTNNPAENIRDVAKRGVAFGGTAISSSVRKAFDGNEASSSSFLGGRQNHNRRTNYGSGSVGRSGNQRKNKARNAQQVEDSSQNGGISFEGPLDATGYSDESFIYDGYFEDDYLDSNQTRGPKGRNKANHYKSSYNGGSTRNYSNRRYNGKTSNSSYRKPLSSAALVQSRCKFLINPNVDWREKTCTGLPVGCDEKAPPITDPRICDPDCLVQWKAVEEVELSRNESAICPICLEHPVAAKITKCGHIYCYPCILHYLALSDKKWRKCPLCDVQIEIGDLRSVVWVVYHDHKVGSVVKMTLMRVSTDFPISFPVDDPTMPETRPRITFSDGNDVEKIINEEIADLQLKLDQDEGQPENIFIEQAIELLKIKLGKLCENYPNYLKVDLGKCIDGVQNIVLDSTNKRISPENRTIDTVFNSDVSYKKSKKKNKSKTKQTLEFTTAFEPAPPKSPEIEGNKSWTISSPEQESSTLKLPGSLDSLERSETTKSHSDRNFDISEIITEKDDIFSRFRSGELKDSIPTNSSISTDEFNYKSEGINVKGQVPHEENNRKDTSYHKEDYFYQANDGSHTYLLPLNMSMINNEFGSRLPSVIQARIIERDPFIVTEKTRKIERFLKNVPMSSNCVHLELDLTDFVSSDTLAKYREPLHRRVSHRTKQMKIERDVEERNIESEKRAMNAFQFMRVSSAVSELPPAIGTLSEFPAVASSSSPSVTAQNSEGASFAKVLRTPNGSKSSIGPRTTVGGCDWPSLQGSSHVKDKGWPTRQAWGAAANVEEEVLEIGLPQSPSNVVSPRGTKDSTPRDRDSAKKKSAGSARKKEKKKAFDKKNIGTTVLML